MKVRSGFVSNSSSSSFIVGFKKKPKDVEELKKILFGDRQEYHNPYGREYWTTDEVAQIVFDDIQKPISKKRALDIIGIKYDTESIKEHKKEGDCDMIRMYTESLGRQLSDLIGLEPSIIGSRMFCNLQAEELVKQIKDVVDAFFKDKKHKYIYCLTYADGDGSLGGAMEHGNLLENVDHMTINGH